jgi:CysZ protein
MVISVVRGAGYLWQGTRLLARTGVRGYVLAPLLISAILFTSLLWFGVTEFGAAVDALMPALPEWLQWLSWLLLPLAFMAALALALLLCVLGATLVAAPFTTPLAAAVERHLQDPTSESGTAAPVGSFWADALHAIGDELRKLCYFATRALPLVVLSVVPGINLLAPPLWLLFSAWMLALEYTEIPLARHGMSVVVARRLVAEHRMTSFGFGLGVLGLTLLPGLQLLAIPAAVAGATVMVVREGMVEDIER